MRPRQLLLFPRPLPSTNASPRLLQPAPPATLGVASHGPLRFASADRLRKLRLDLHRPCNSPSVIAAMPPSTVRLRVKKGARAVSCSFMGCSSRPATTAHYAITPRASATRAVSCRSFRRYYAAFARSLCQSAAKSAPLPFFAPTLRCLAMVSSESSSTREDTPRERSAGES